MGPAREQREATFARLAQHFFRTFPQLEDIRFTHRWGGPIDTCSRFFAFYGLSHGGRVAYAAGHTGLGIGASRFGARVALDLLAGRDTEATRLEARPHAPGPVPARAAALGGDPGHAPGARARRPAPGAPRPLAAIAGPARFGLRQLGDRFAPTTTEGRKAMSTTPPVSARPSGLARWAALGGVAYVVLFIAGVALIDSGAPDFDAPPQEVIKYWGDSGNRDQAALGWGLIVLGVFFLLWFVGALREFMRRIDADGLLTTMAMIGGAVYAATTLVGAGLQAGILTMSDDTFQDRVFPELIHAARDAGYVIHTSGGAGVAALIVAASLAARAGGLIPGWAGVLGVIVGVLAIGSIFFIPMILVAIWFVVASFGLFRAASGPREALPGPD